MLILCYAESNKVCRLVPGINRAIRMDVREHFLDLRLDSLKLGIELVELVLWLEAVIANCVTLAEFTSIIQEPFDYRLFPAITVIVLQINQLSLLIIDLVFFILLGIFRLCLFGFVKALEMFLDLELFISYPAFPSDYSRH